MINATDLFDRIQKRTNKKPYFATGAVKKLISIAAEKDGFNNLRFLADVAVEKLKNTDSTNHSMWKNFNGLLHNASDEELQLLEIDPAERSRLIQESATIRDTYKNKYESTRSGKPFDNKLPSEEEYKTFLDNKSRQTEEILGKNFLNYDDLYKLQILTLALLYGLQPNVRTLYHTVRFKCYDYTCNYLLWNNYRLQFVYNRHKNFSKTNQPIIHDVTDGVLARCIRKLIEYSTQADVDWLFYNYKLKHSYTVEQMRDLVAAANVELGITARDLRLLDESIGNQDLPSLDALERQSELRGHWLLQALKYVRELK
jgi:hypothetical protein